MKFSIPKSIEILERTPATLYSLLSGLSHEWLYSNEGENTWSPYDIVGHLIHGEKTDWMVRAKVILSDKEDKTFVPFDRFAQMNDSEQKTMLQLLEEFDTLRKENIAQLIELKLDSRDLSKTGIHPELGTAQLNELLSTWVVHDLGHIAQISRVMAKQYKGEVGPWIEYLTIVK